MSPSRAEALITRPLTQIRAEQGFAFLARTGKPSLSSHRHPSTALVLEDGAPLPGPANALHDDIRGVGQGRFSFWHDHVYFSASDNSDPRTNGRKYSVWYSAAADREYRRLRWSRIVEQLRPGDLLWMLLYWLAFHWVYHSIPSELRASWRRRATRSGPSLRH